MDFAAAASGLGRGANYGWRVREGRIATPGIGDPTPSQLTDPVFDYGHVDGANSIIGGYVYRGGADAALEGRYVFGDFGSGRMWTLGGGTASPLASPFGAGTPTSFGEGGDGALYAVGIDGRVFLLAAAVPEPAHAALLVIGAAAMGLFIRRRRA